MRPSQVPEIVVDPSGHRAAGSPAKTGDPARPDDPDDNLLHPLARFHQEPPASIGDVHADLRRLKRSNFDLAAAKDQAELANRAKTRLLAAASHDVLQPLAAAQLTMSALSELQVSEAGRRLARHVERSLSTMGDLLRTLVDIARLDAGAIEPQMTDVELGPLLASLHADFHPLASGKDIALIVRPSSAAVRSDATMLRRIVQNILANAVRYTATGGVLVGVRRRGATVRIDVVDTGAGIPDEQHQTIFEEFRRGSGAANDAAGGLGLGLAIVRRMAAALGHDLEFRSIPERGTRFSITLALSATGRPREAVRPSVGGLSGAKVLTLTDDPTAAEPLLALFDRWQCSSRLAVGQTEAIAALGDTAWIPEVLVTDHHLDHGDRGLVAIAEVRAYVGKAMPAVLLTGDPSETLASAARLAGVELTRKPVKPALLRSLLTRLLI